MTIAGPSIALIDRGCKIARSDLDDCMLAIQTQLDRDFAPRYFLTAALRVATADAPPGDAEWALELWPHPDQVGVLGHHDTTDHGVPILRCFPLLDAGDGIPWTVTVSHEVMEALADPGCNGCVQVPDGRIYAKEVADPVEQDIYEINVQGAGSVAVSNFVFPSYFEPPRNRDGVQYDMMGLVKSPLELRPGGYNQFWTPDKGWQQQTSMRGIRPTRMTVARYGLSRGSRRMNRQGAAA